VEVAALEWASVAACVREGETEGERMVRIGENGEKQLLFSPIGLGSTSSGRFGRTGAFRICTEYSLPGNEAIPFHSETEHKNASEERNRPIPFHQILQPNTPLLSPYKIVGCFGHLIFLFFHTACG
jgi:hypothetical protein